MFFVGTGVGLDVTALFHSGRAILGVPIFLLAPLLVRGLPAVLYAPIVGGTHAAAAGGSLLPRPSYDGQRVLTLAAATVGDASQPAIRPGTRPMRAWWSISSNQASISASNTQR